MKKCFILLLLFISIGIQAQNKISDAQALFLYNFSRLINWPNAQETNEFVIGVLGNSDISGSLSSLTQGKLVGNKKVVIKQFKDVSELTTDCHMLFISYGKSNQIGDVNSKIAGRPILVVGERNGLLNEGAAINFLIIQDKLKFEVSAENAQKQKVAISSALINMAHKS